MWICHSLFLHTAVRDLPCCWLWVILNNAAMNTLVPVFWWICVFIYVGHFSGRIAELESVHMCLYLVHTAGFLKPFYQPTLLQEMTFICSTPSPKLVLCFHLCFWFLYLALLHCSMIWICISVMTNQPRLLFMCLLVIWTSFTVYCLFKSFIYFLLGHLPFLLF